MAHQQVGVRSSGSLSSDGRSSRTSGASSNYSESNYMNVTTDGLFAENFQDHNMNHIVESTDDIDVGKQSKQQFSSLLYAGNTQSLPPGIQPGSIAKFNMLNQSTSSESFIVEHLASFPQDGEQDITPAYALVKLKEISSHGGLWAQKMSMNISSESLSMANAESQELIEEYPIQQISLCVTVDNDDVLENLLIFTTKLSQDKVGAIHLFQCKAGEAGVIKEVVNKQRERKALQQQQVNSTNYMNGSSSPSPPTITETNGMAETRTEWNLHQRHAVARAVEAFQSPQEEKPPTQHNMTVNGTNPMQDAKIARDVEILNKCIEEIENFVVMLKRINEARKQLQLKKSRGSKKKKIENILILQSQPPPDHRIFDIYQKFKHSLNLLGKLHPHISEPNAPELIHYLFIPLGIIVKVTGIERARSVVEPLLTLTAVELLGNCLDSREYHFWQSLGPNWTLTKNAEPFKDRYFQPYSPVFIDGWVPPEIVTPQQEAAATSIARMQQDHVTVVRTKSNASSQHSKAPTTRTSSNASSTILPTTRSNSNASSSKTPAARSNSNASSTMSNGIVHVNRQPVLINDEKKPEPVPVTRIEKRSMKSGTNQVDGNPALRNNSFNNKLKVRYGIVVYDYLAHNNKELTIHAGEKVEVIDNSRRWWLVKNTHGDQGYVPSTVLEIPAADAEEPTSPKPEIPAYSPRSPNGHEHFSGMDSNQNYVNHLPPQPRTTPPTTAVQHIQQKPSPIPQPVKTTTPVVISVQLPEGRVSVNNSPITIEPVEIETRPSPPVVQEMNQERSSSSPVYAAVAKKKTITTTAPRPPSNESASAVITTDYQKNGYHKSTAVIRTQASPPTVQPELNTAPPPPPPPAVPPPPPVVEQQKLVLTKKTSSSSTSSGSTGGMKRDDSANDLQYELKNRLSMHGQPDVPAQKPLNRVDSVPGSQPAMPDVDAVDVFIPLYKSSTADDVSRWLGKLGFSQQTINSLKGKTALELFNTNKDDMIDLIGQSEGLQLYEELQVQNGAKTRNKTGTMTELQKALVKRVKKREDQHELAKRHHQSPVGQEMKTPPPVQSKPQNGDISSQASMIRKQKEELERLKKENPVNRNPGSATFTSFSSPAQS
uniref:SH3 domain-containing protein n=1 Tax=Clytia hemisphaerica TaxID=252671 RepID=A0A7M5WJE7_9CNID